MTAHATLNAPAFADPELDATQKPPPGHTGRLPPGLGFAQWLREALLASGREINNRWSTDFGHAFDVTIVGRRFDVMIERRDEKGRFALTVEKRRALLPWARKPDPEGERTVCLAIYSACLEDARVSDLRWYRAEDWGDSDHLPGAVEPLATG